MRLIDFNPHWLKKRASPKLHPTLRDGKEFTLNKKMSFSAEYYDILVDGPSVAVPHLVAARRGM